MSHRMSPNDPVQIVCLRGIVHSEMRKPWWTSWNKRPNLPMLLISEWMTKFSPSSLNNSISSSAFSSPCLMKSPALLDLQPLKSVKTLTGYQRLIIAIQLYRKRASGLTFQARMSSPPVQCKWHRRVLIFPYHLDQWRRLGKDLEKAAKECVEDFSAIALTRQNSKLMSSRFKDLEQWA